MIFTPDYGSETIPHHASDKMPSSMEDALVKNRNGLTACQSRLNDIAKALDRVGLKDLAKEIHNEVDDIGWFRDMMDKSYRDHVNTKT